MQKYSLIQVNFKQGPTSLNSYHLPYSAGLLASYSMSIPDIRSKWCLHKLIWKREPIETLAQDLKNDQVIGFSTYVWNREYNYALAKRIKQLNPKCIIVMGGPEPASSDTNVFQKLPWIDIIIKHEGELAWAAILQNFPNTTLNIPGALINNGGSVMDTGPALRIDDINCIPSPYLSGIFDSIIAAHPEVSWSSTLETNRGCPYACTFCDTGNKIYNKIKIFDLQRVLNEIDWMGRHCGYISVADANFGMMDDRDAVILDKLIEVQNTNPQLDNIGITWAKNKKPRIFDMMESYAKNTSHGSQGLTLSVQDMDPAVLDIIKRKNLDRSNMAKMLDWCKSNQIPFYTELILGLPGQTLESWKQNLWSLFDVGNHNGINIHQCEVIENTEMNRFQRLQYGIKTATVSDYFGGSKEQDGITECTKIVIGTKDFPKDHMLDAWVWNSFLQTFHVNGITTNIARYLNYTQNVQYQEFYQRLYSFLQNNSWLQQQFAFTIHLYNEWIEQGRINQSSVAGVEIPGWNLHNRMTMVIHAEKKLGMLYQEVKDFLDLNYTAPYVDKLIDFQRDCILDFECLKQYPIYRETDLDFFGFLNNNLELERSCLYKIDTLENKNMDFQTYLENFYFGRKRLFGSTRISVLY